LSQSKNTSERVKLKVERRLEEIEEEVGVGGRRKCPNVAHQKMILDSTKKLGLVKNSEGS